MDVNFYEKIRFQAAVLINAQELAAYNFHFNPSIKYLDLEINEKLLRDIQPFPFKAILTDEGIRKKIHPDRQILYRFHLDLPENLESFSCKNRTEIVTQNVFHLKEIRIMNRAYIQGLERHIVAAIENSSRKIEKLRSYIKILKLLNFAPHNDIAIFLCDSILTMLSTMNCTDSGLLKDFLALFYVPLWISQSEIPRVLEYVLVQAQKSQFSNDLWECLEQRIDPATICFLCHRVKNMYLLIKYGTIAFIPREFNFDKYIPGNKFNRVVALGIVSYSRAFRIFQLFFEYLYHQRSPRAFRCMWRSIKDPFLSTKEMNSTLRPMIPPRMIECLRSHYVKCITGEDNCSFRPTPRTLKDLCRVDIRRYLSYNHQVPFGIADLVIAENLKSYLNLEW